MATTISKRLAGSVTRAPGDYGTAGQAVDWVLDHSQASDAWAADFLRAWREGDLEDWPEFLNWLDAIGSDHREPLWPRIRGSLLAVLATGAVAAAGLYTLTHRFLFGAVVTATCAATLQSIGA